MTHHGVSRRHTRVAAAGGTHNQVYDQTQQDKKSHLVVEQDACQAEIGRIFEGGSCTLSSGWEGRSHRHKSAAHLLPALTTQQP